MEGGREKEKEKNKRFGEWRGRGESTGAIHLDLIIVFIDYFLR